MKKHTITEKEYAEIKAAIKANTNKRVDKRLQAIALRYEGKKDQEIAEKLGYSRHHVSILCSEFAQKGLIEYTRPKYGGNRQRLSDEEEQAILNIFVEKAAAGQVITIQEIKRAYDAKRRKDTGNYIYEVLKRHGWRPIVPRSKHPKKANDEEIEASKKLRP